MADRITENSLVRLREEYANKGRREQATVTGWISDIDGGVIVSPPLEGFRCWNVEHLELVPRKGKKNEHQRD